jgi:hypothetical protein
VPVPGFGQRSAQFESGWEGLHSHVFFTLPGTCGLADYESRKGPVSEPARQRARQVFDEVFAEEAEWPAAG